MSTIKLNIPIITDGDIYTTEWSPRLLFLDSTALPSSIPYGIDSLYNTKLGFSKFKTLKHDYTGVGDDNNIVLNFSNNKTYTDDISLSNISLYNKFYKEDIELNLDDNAYLVTVKVKLNSKDISDLDFRNKIYLSNSKIGSGIFRLNSIKKYVPDGLSTVELIKLNTVDATYDSTIVPTNIERSILSTTEIVTQNSSSSTSGGGTSVDTTQFVKITGDTMTGTLNVPTVNIGTTTAVEKLNIKGTGSHDLVLENAGIGFAAENNYPDLVLARWEDNFLDLANWGSDNAAIATVFRISAHQTEGKEATLALIRGAGSNTEFVDIYNNGYDDSTQYGIRLQKRGTGQYRDFVFDQYDGNTFNNIMKLTSTGNVEIDNSLYLNGIPSGAKTKMLYYDVSTKSVSYSDVPTNAFPTNVHILGELEVDGDTILHGGVTLDSTLQANGSVIFQGIPSATTTKFLYYNETTDVVSYGSLPDIDTTGDFTVNGELNVTQAIIADRITIDNDAQINGQVYLQGISEASANKMLYYNPTTDAVSYYNVPTSYWALNDNKLTYTDNTVYVGGLLVDDVIEWSNGNTIWSGGMLFQEAESTISAGSIESLNLLAESKVELNTSEVYMGYLSGGTTSNILYIDTTTGKITYGLAPSGGSMVYPSAGIPLSTGTAWGTSISTLAALNAAISDATLIDTTDSRLSNARTPTAHAMDSATYHTSSDVTTLNATTSKHGFLPKLAGGTTTFLRADGTWATPAGTSPWTISGSNIYYNSGNVLIGTATDNGYKLHMHASHTATQFLMHSTGGGAATTEADLMFWASEPGSTYSGVGIANNVVNTASFPRINTARGGSFIRLLDNAINFNTTTSAGVNTVAMYISGGNVTTEGKLSVGSTDQYISILAAGGIESNTYFSSSDSALVLSTSTTGIITFRPNGHSTTAQSTFTPTLATIGSSLTVNGNITSSGNITTSGTLTADNLSISATNSTPNYFNKWSNFTVSEMNIRTNGSGTALSMRVYASASSTSDQIVGQLPSSSLYPSAPVYFAAAPEGALNEGGSGVITTGGYIYLRPGKSGQYYRANAFWIL